MGIFNEVSQFYQNYGGEKQIIGKSVNGLPIYAFAVTKTASPIVLVQGAIHAREFVTAKVVNLLASEFIKSGKQGKVWFLPLINPDGAIIAESVDGSFKANANGVDLNVNFPARWGKGRQNVFVKDKENFVGEKPLSEPETKALCNFTLKIKPDMTISYHSKGEEIYYEFYQKGKRRERDAYLADIASKTTGYVVKSIKGSCGGYKDWCIQRLKIPALTIEVGNDCLSHPISLDKAEEIAQKNSGLIEKLIEGLLWLKNL